MKKFLSLVLALIMTMSLVTIGAGATEYRDLTDKDEIQYEEAVAVLNRIGVITGYEDGSFRPETELTRGAAAKIIVSLLIGPEAASNLPNATAPYPDVPASHTFAGVISYCKTAGIISGYGDGTFKPGNSLTGFAFAKMLLGALGYKSEIEGFVDTGWTMNVAKVGNVTGLFDRLDFDGSAAVNREEACQLALNTLKATMVTYGGTTLVSGNQNLAVANTQAMYVTSNNREINANINRRVINAVNNEMTLEFGEEHFKDLRLEHDKYDPAYDDFGHPSNEWSYKKVTIGTFKLPADFTYTTQVAYREDSAATKEKALGLRGYDTYSTDHRNFTANWSTASSNNTWNSPFADATQITINGWNSRIWDASYTQTPAPATTWEGKGRQDGIQYSYDAFDITNATKNQAPSLSEIADLTDNGVTVEVYVCPVDADFITNVVVTRTQLMKVDRIGTDFVTLDRISPDSRDPRRTPSDGLAKITGYNAFAVDVDVADVKDSNYDPYNVLKDLKVGDRVAVVPYTPDEGETYEVGVAYVPETVSGRLSDVGLYMNTSKPDGNAISITVGGTKYVINEWNLDMIDVKKAQINATRKDVTAYLAADGTVLWTTEIGNSDAWMIVGDYYQATNSSGKVVWFAHGWTIGGEEIDVDLGTIRHEAEIYAPGELVHYQLASGGTGEYELEKPNYTQSKSWYSKGGAEVERRLTKTIDGVVRATGEGIYNVAQFVKNNGVDRAYSIHAANSLIPLENYDNYKTVGTAFNTATGGAIYFGESDPDRTITTDDAAAHIWNYRSTTYKDDGVKFIYVNFDGVTGEVDYISVRKDAQNVENAELAGMNMTWKNTATNSNNADSAKDWVISPAEAYVNDEGNVEAVVIKSEPTVADLSNVVIVGEYVGTEIGRTTGAEETTPTNAHAREYWQGPDFSEKKTGYFKNQHNVGDIVVIRATKDNVMDCKMFNGGLYSDRNPDVFKASGIDALKNSLGTKSKIAFYVGKDLNSVSSQNGSINLKTSGSTIMSDLKVEADILEDLDELKVEGNNYKGLVKVAGAKWIDLRANRGNKDVRSLSDLLDLDEDSVRITVLVNANDNTDTFRRAYAIVVTGGIPSGEAPAQSAGNVTLASEWGKYLNKVNGTFGTATLNKFTGIVSFNLKTTAPSWAAGTLTYDVDLYVNGAFLETVSVTPTKSGDNWIGTGRSSVSVNPNLVDLETATVSGIIKNVTWTKAKVQYVYEDGNGVNTTVGTYQEELNVGETNKEALAFTYTVPAGFTAGTVTYEITSGAEVPSAQKTGSAAAPVSISNAYAKGGEFVVVTIKGVTPSAVYKVSALTAGQVEFAIIPTKDDAGVNGLTPADWKTELTNANKDCYVAIRVAGGKAGLTAVTVLDKNGAVVSTATQTTSPVTMTFTMPASDVSVTGVKTNAPVVKDSFIKNDYSKINLLLEAGGTATTAEKLALAKKVLEDNGKTVTEVKNADGTVTGLTVDGHTITAGDIQAAPDLVTATINTKKVIGSSNADKLDDLLTLAGITPITDAFLFVKEGTNTFVAGDDIATTDPSGKTYDTNMVSGTSKWYAQLAGTPVTLTDAGSLLGAGATVAVTDGLITGGSNKYVAIGQELTVTFTAAGSPTSPAAGGIKVTPAPTKGTLASNAATNIVATGGEISAGDTFEVKMTVATATDVGVAVAFTAAAI